MSITQTPFGFVDGRTVELFTLTNAAGMAVKITNYGGTVTSLVVPDRDREPTDIVCGFDSLDGYFSETYRENSPYFGCVVGRYAGRVKDGRFKVPPSDRDHILCCNDGANHIHGGLKGFDKRVWDAVAIQEGSDAVLELRLHSPDGEEGYPGNLEVLVEYRLTPGNELRIRYRATTDQTTPVALTNHTYFNLNGFTDNIFDHVVTLHSDRYLVPDETNVPVGAEALVEGTMCDFREPRRVGDCFAELPMGFEHFYVFEPQGKMPTVAATIHDPTSGRTLEVLTTEPGGLFYTARYTSNALQREDGTQFGQFRAFCMETAKYPNGPNIEGAPNCILAPGQHYDETTVYRLSWA